MRTLYVILKAINTYAISANSYRFGIIKWTNTELGDVNTKTRKQFKKCRAHNPKPCVERFPLTKKGEGRGIQDPKARHNRHLDKL